MLAGAALLAGIHFQAQAARRGGIVAPGGDYEKLFADQERRPGIVGMLDPVDVGTFDRIAETAAADSRSSKKASTQPSCSMMPVVLAS